VESVITKLTTGILAAMLAVLCCATAVYAEGLVINEFLAINDSILADEDGEYSDWIEIYNGSTNTVDLDGWFLTDNSGELDKWRIPSISLDIGDYIVFGPDRLWPSGPGSSDFKKPVLDTQGDRNPSISGFTFFLPIGVLSQFNGSQVLDQHHNSTEEDGG
jgi:hypothetical protein